MGKRLTLQYNSEPRNNTWNGSGDIEQKAKIVFTTSPYVCIDPLIMFKISSYRLLDTFWRGL